MALTSGGVGSGSMALQFPHRRRAPVSRSLKVPAWGKGRVLQHARRLPAAARRQQFFASQNLMHFCRTAASQPAVLVTAEPAIAARMPAFRQRSTKSLRPPGPGTSGKGPQMRLGMKARLSARCAAPEARLLFGVLHEREMPAGARQSALSGKVMSWLVFGLTGRRPSACAALSAGPQPRRYD